MSSGGICGAPSVSDSAQHSFRMSIIICYNECRRFLIKSSCSCARPSNVYMDWGARRGSGIINHSTNNTGVTTCKTWQAEQEVWWLEAEEEKLKHNCKMPTISILLSIQLETHIIMHVIYSINSVYDGMQ